MLLSSRRLSPSGWLLLLGGLLLSASPALAADCKDGQSLIDGAHCCWPGQSWSPTSNACEGVPRCEQGFEAVGGRCLPLDQDHDGVPDVRDRCPTQAEEINGFRDDDGCPDAAEFEAKKQAFIDSINQRERLRRRDEALLKVLMHKDGSPPPARHRGEPRTEQNVAERAGGHSTLSTIGAVSYVASGLFLAAGTGFGIAALTTRNGFKDGCVDMRCPPSASGDLDTARAHATRSTVLFILGGATFATGLTLRIVGDRQKRQDDLAWSLHLGPLGAGLARGF